MTSSARAAADIYLISPSGAVEPGAPVQRAIDNLARAGLTARLDPAALRVRQRFAGSDADRAGAFARAAAQPAPIVMITRGGYGLTRYLDALDYKALARARKRWVGLSDFTAFQLAMLAKARAVHLGGARAAGRLRRRALRGHRRDDARHLPGGDVRSPRDRRVPLRRPGRRRGARHPVGRQPGDRLRTARHALVSEGRRRHPVPRGCQRAPVPHRTHAHAAAACRRARPAEGDPAGPVQPLPARRQRSRLRPAGGGPLAARAHAHAGADRAALRAREPEAHAAARCAGGAGHRGPHLLSDPAGTRTRTRNEHGHGHGHGH